MQGKPFSRNQGKPNNHVLTIKEGVRLRINVLRALNVRLQLPYTSASMINASASTVFPSALHTGPQ